MSNENLDAAVATLQTKMIAGLALKLHQRISSDGRGSMDSRWDVLFDAQAFLKGEQTILTLTAEGWIAELERLLAQT